MKEPIDPRPWERAVEGGPLRFAIVGVGQFARNYILPAVERTAHCRAPVLVSPEEDTPADSDRTLLQPEAFHDGVASDGYDAVYIATPNHRHESIAESAASMGKPVLCEKPLAATAAGARRIRETVSAADVALMVGYRVQFKPVMRAVRNAVQDGLVGAPVHAHSGVSFRIGRQDTEKKWRLDTETGGGALRDIGISPINTLRFLLDQSLSASWADLRTVSGLGDVDVHAAFALEGDDGFVGLCDASFASEPTSHLRITGTEGMVVIDEPYHPSAQPEVTVVADGTAETIVPDGYDEYAGELDYFAQCVLRGEPPEPDVEEGIADLDVIESIERLDGQ